MLDEQWIARFGLTYCDTDGHTEATEKPVHGCGHGTVFDLRNRLDTDIDAGQHHARTDAEEGKRHSDDDQPCVEVEDDEKAAGGCCDSPTEPDRPAKSPKPRTQGGDNNRAWDKETHSREKVDTCCGWRLPANRHEEKGNVVESREEL